jgi:hypothetical protein
MGAGPSVYSSKKTTHQASLDEPGSSRSVYRHCPLGRVLNVLDLVEVLLDPGEFFKDRVVASLDTMESQIC